MNNRQPVLTWINAVLLGDLVDLQKQDHNTKILNTKEFYRIFGIIWLCPTFMDWFDLAHWPDVADPFQHLHPALEAIIAHRLQYGWFV